ncbi:heat shock 70 kDa protein 12A-like [Pecten maximus]|uniref:heat shock 70 kDa protein 12A-like n=1 Tax=Pecten maximus TaxID=6579 RepID=UPI001458AF74|nr:heat shock 70 kDa protein 12A-like [Pecten maximus]
MGIKAAKIRNANSRNKASAAKETTSHPTKDVKFLNDIVVAIEIGTEFSGLAYCTKSWYNYRGGPRIHIHSWPAQMTMTGKAPTCVLLDSDKKFISFGHEANFDFVEEKCDTKDCYFFKHFRMKLSEMKEELSGDTMLESQNGKAMPAIRVFSAVIEFFKDKLLTGLESKDPSSRFHASDIHWVLTVPAIWNFKAKQFMREAAHKAGIDDNQLTLALEPEAASLYCRKVPSSVDRKAGGGPSIANFKAGAKYLIMDLGGGTIDITAHEVLEDGHFKEIIEPTGVSWGSRMVKEEFTRFLQRLCGQDVLSELQRNTSADWPAIIVEFERKMFAYDPKAKMETITIRIPSTLPAEFEKNDRM